MNERTIFDLAKHTHLIPSLVDLHCICITQPTHMIATFLPPFSIPVMTKWWEDRISEIETGKRTIIFQPSDHEDKVLGVVMLSTPLAETGPFRASVEKLLVHPDVRGKGIARGLMARLEEEAGKKGTWLLMLDTEKGSPAEIIYPKLGYVKIGEIPDYGISPLDRRLTDGLFFYKDLRKGEST